MDVLHPHNNAMQEAFPPNALDVDISVWLEKPSNVQLPLHWNLERVNFFNGQTRLRSSAVSTA